jgi:hypothetical protein
LAWLSKILCLLLLVSLFGSQLLQARHPEHAEPSAPCYQQACAPTADTGDSCDDCLPCDDPEDCGRNHHHHDFGCCSLHAFNALATASRIPLIPPTARFLCYEGFNTTPGESPVYPIDKPPVI